MTCEKCEAAVLASFRRFTGLSIEVDWHSGRLALTGEPQPDAAAVAHAVDEAGFELAGAETA